MEEVPEPPAGDDGPWSRLPPPGPRRRLPGWSFMAWLGMILAVVFFQLSSSSSAWRDVAISIALTILAIFLILRR